MNSEIILLCIILYFIGLLIISYFSSRKSDNQSFFNGGKKSKWWLVAFGTIGTTLSGVTFVSVPGTVGKITGTNYIYGGFEYYMMVIGFFIGYFFVLCLLLPIYYKLNLISIYTYLEKRFNIEAHKTGAIFFIISRAIVSAARLYLVINILHFFLLENIGIPFWITTFVLLLMILLYTFRGGVRTIVITDTLQTLFMLISLIVCIYYVLSNIDLNICEAFHSMQSKNYTHFINTDYNSRNYFLKTILGGIFITIAMTGLDQEMMQKNISIDNLENSKRNMITFAVTLLIVNLGFLFLGGLLYIYAIHEGGFYTQNGFFLVKGGKNIMGDDIFPTLSLSGLYFPSFFSIIFIIGLISALFPSADGALTAITSSYCIDILKINDNKIKTEIEKRHIRLKIHLTFTAIFFALIMIFKIINNKSIVYLVIDIVGYTYGPLLGLFSFGILTKRYIYKRYAIITISMLSPILTYIINVLLIHFTNYKIGIELIIVNGLLTFLGLYWISTNKKRIKFYNLEK